MHLTLTQLPAMKSNRFVLLFLLFAIPYLSFSQTAKPVYVIVHGAWGGSWAFKKVDSLLTEKGGLVYRPSLTGQGERVHLATTTVGLKTHITDVVNTILFEDLHDVILIGHSYGGMVITGVADSLPGRIRKMVYLDAFLPENGESVFTLFAERASSFKEMIKDGFIVPRWVAEGKAPPKDVPHPLKTFTDNLLLSNKSRNGLPATYILTVAKGTDPAKDDFASQAERAKKKGWPVLQLEADHNPQWSAPVALVKMLEEARK
jgi:pimeloyl-ACP methyl ester carboxylesterase